jgi:putative phosphoesterase
MSSSVITNGDFLLKCTTLTHIVKIGLISDTHDNIENILKAVKEFNSRQVDIVLHTGDFVSPIAVESFAGIKLVGILGNNDTDIVGLTSAFNKIHGELKGETFEAVYDGIKLVIYHGTNSSKKEFLIKSGKYDMVIYGHTHRKANYKIGRTTVVNPGAAKGLFFGFYATIAIFDTYSRIIEFVNL